MSVPPPPPPNVPLTKTIPQLDPVASLNPTDLLVVQQGGATNKATFQQITNAIVTTASTGTVTAVVAGIGLNGGTITQAGTIALTPATTAALGGVVVGSGFSVNSGGTISTTGTGSGSVTEVFTGAGLTGGPITNVGTIALTPATTAALGGVVAGTGLSINAGGTLTSPGGTVQSVGAGAGLTGGPITTAGTLSVLPATTVSLGGVVVGSGFTINTGGTISTSGTGAGSVTEVFTGAGLAGGPITTTGTLSVVAASQGTLGGIGTVTNPGVALTAGSLTLPLASASTPGFLAAIAGGGGTLEPNGTLYIPTGGAGSNVVVTAGNTNVSIGTVSNAGTTTYAVSATGTLTGGLPTPGTASIVGTVASNAYVVLELASGGSPEYITPANFYASTSTYPTGTTTTAAHATDFLLLGQSGTFQVSTLSQVFSAFAAYQAANQPIIALTSPSTAPSHTASFGISGTLSNYATTPTLQLAISGPSGSGYTGVFGALPSGSSYTLTTISLVIPALGTAGNYTLQLQDQNGVKSNAIGVTAT